VNSASEFTVFANLLTELTTWLSKHDPEKYILIQVL